MTEITLNNFTNVIEIIDDFPSSINKPIFMEFAEYWYTNGFHYVKSKSNLTDVEYSKTIFTKEFLKIVNRIGLYNENGQFSIGEIEQKVITKENGDDTMTEISPITATIGEITTPNGKGKRVSNYEEKYNEPELKFERNKYNAQMNLDNENFYQLIFDSILPKIVLECNMI